MGSFSVQVPLKIGDNLLTVTAADIHGNSAAKAVTVTQTLTALPVITITGPADGAVVTTERIDVTGTVRSSLPPEQIRLLLADQVVFAQGSNNLYTFTFENVTLVAGSNLLTVRAETAYGNVSTQIAVQYGDTSSQEQAQKPVIQVYSPLPDTFLSAAATVTGQVTGAAAITSVTVNGQPAQVAGLGSTSASFKAGLSLSVDGAPLAITIDAQDAAGQSASLTYTVYADTAPPVISLADTGLQAPPAVNPVTTSPYTVSGTVTDANLAGLSVNDQPVALSPTATAGTYSFAAGLPLTYGSDQSVTVMAWDQAGNRTGAQWIVTLDSDLTIEVIAPASGARLQGQGTAMDVAVTVRVAGAAADDRFFATADGGSAVELTRSGTVGNGTVSVSTTQEDHQLNLSVQNSAGDTLAATTSTFSVQDMDAVPLAVEKLKPANGATGIEPNDFIALYFNKAIDPALLQIEVLETAHGKTYAAAASGADITQLSAVELVEVHRDRETVPGGVSILPGNQTAAFYPSRDLAYGAEVFVTATYDGTELTRATYNVRPLPTLIEGFVTDSATNPVAGIQVKIDGLDFTTVTNTDGAYSFGFGMDAAKSLPAGRHKLIVNPGMQNSEWGTLGYWARVTQGRLCAVPAIRLPRIDARIPFRRIVSGQAANLLADGALKLDLSAAQLTFADLRDQGDVHAQFLSVQQLPYAPMAFATPLWMFCIQPGGVKVSGQVGLTLAVPARQGGYAYLDNFGPLVVLVGLEPDALVLAPVGVGRLDADSKTVVSQGAVHLQRLDFIGYAHMPEAAQPLLQQYIDGAVDLATLTAQLEQMP
jgi:hypothetical protein